MQDQIKKGTDNFVPLSVIMTFSRLKALTEDPAVVLEAIADSEVVELVSLPSPYYNPVNVGFQLFFCISIE